MKPSIAILLVEDSPDDAELIGRAVRAAPFVCSIDCVETESEYLDRLSAKLPDVVLCDYHLPRFDCNRALSLLQERSASTPFIVLSHNIGEDAAVESLRNGASDYLLKSRLGRLSKAIESAIDRGEMLQAKDIAEEALRQSEMHKRGILNSLPTRVALLDGSGVILAVNRAWNTFASVRQSLQDRACDVGDNYLEFLESMIGRFDYVAEGLAGLQAVMARQKSQYSLEYQISMHGITRWYVVRGMPLEGGSAGLVVSHEDISEQKLSQFALQDANRRLQALSQRVLTIQEEERRNISRELHDDLGQTLTALKMGLHSVGAGEPAARQQRLEQCLQVADSALEKIRQMALELHPPQLDHLGVGDALRWLAERHGEQTGIAVSCDIDRATGRLAPTIEHACYRIAQEALSNASRHASANLIKVVLTQQENMLCMQIEDDGKGFDFGAARERAIRTGSLGLLSMEERAQLAGGKMELHSTVGKGTIITVSFPLHGRHDAGGDTRETHR